MFIYEFFFFNDTATTEIYTLSLHDALPILVAGSIFTFALTIGDYITPSIVGAGKQFIGNVVYANVGVANRSEEHTSELQSRQYLVCRLLLEKKKYQTKINNFYNSTTIPKQP